MLQGILDVVTGSPAWTWLADTILSSMPPPHNARDQHNWNNVFSRMKEGHAGTWLVVFAWTGILGAIYVWVVVTSCKAICPDVHATFAGAGRSVGPSGSIEVDEVDFNSDMEEVWERQGGEDEEEEDDGHGDMDGIDEGVGGQRRSTGQGSER